MNKDFKILSIFILISALLVPMVLADINPPVNNAYAEITEVKINGDVAQPGDDLYVERGDKLTVRVTVKAVNGDMNDAYLGAFISGYRYAHYESQLVTDFSNTFTLPEGNKRSIELNLEVPMDMETKDAKLRLILFDENSASIITYNYQISINGANENNAVEIRDFFISPSTTIEAGRALSFKVKIKNFGNYDLDDLKVKVSIPELDIQTYETIDTLEKDEVQSFEALLLRIPADADPGNYEVVATVEFDKYEEVSESATIEIIEPKGTPCSGTACDPTNDLSKTVITMPVSVDVIAGSQGSIYPILVENKGTTSKTYVLSTSGVSDWGTAVFEPSSVFVLKAGQSQTVYLKLVPLKDATIGDKVMKITINAGDELKDTTVIASLKQGTTKTTSNNASLKSILEWFLVVLVIVLIILGLVVAFKKLRKGKDSEDEEQSYY